MEKIKICELTTLQTENGDKFGGITFSGSFFYLTVPNKRCIYKLDQKFEQIDCLKTNKAYNMICYDCTENCFWASEDKIVSDIYKLNTNFKKIDKIAIKNTCSPIKGLSYDCQRNILMVAYSNEIIEVAKDSSAICVLKKCSSGSSYESVLSISPCWAVIWQDKFEQIIKFYNNKSDCSFKSLCISDEYNIQDFIFFPSQESCKHVIEIILLATKYCNQASILRCCIIDSDIKLSYCNHKARIPNCSNDCKAEPCNCRHYRNHKKNECVWDLIESIALVETALSHILNAEGEKLQKAVQISDNINDLLEVNRSINKTLTNVTFVENALYAKLNELNELCARI